MATTVDTLDEATELARRLQDRGRLRPAVVITIAAAQAEPWVDVAEVESGVAGLADVVVLATGALTRQFQEKMPPRTHVFGGASRVYPTSDEWQTDPYRSPLRFAYGPADSTRVAEQLVTDALGMAVSAGLVRQRRERSVAAEAVVRGFPVPSRAIVAVSGGMATIQQELTFAGVPLERVVSPGQFVRGLLDRQERTLDVRPFATEPAQVLAAYELGIVVLARVRSVHAEVVELDLHPDVVVSVTIAEVTGNPYDQLTSLLSPGEVVPARLTGWGTGQWALSLIDVDDDEDVVPAVALLPGGPPWLTLSAPVAEQDRHDEPWALPDQRPASIEAPVFAPARPSPLLLDPTRSLAAAPRTTRPTGAAGEPSAAFETERAEVRRLRAELARLAEQMKAFEAERDMTTSRLQELERERAKRGAEVEHLRTRVRNEVRRRERAERGRREPAGSTEEAVGLFVGREDQLRHEVYLAWTRRIPAAEKGERPLGDYHVGPAFLDSVAAVAGVERGKVVDVIVEVVTGLAEALPGRDLHQLRTGRGGDDRPVVRACDQATCWRVALQTGTPQARRLHFWRTRQGVELSRVVLHDDMDP